MFDPARYVLFGRFGLERLNESNGSWPRSLTSDASLGLLKSFLASSCCVTLLVDRWEDSGLMFLDVPPFAP